MINQYSFSVTTITKLFSINSNTYNTARIQKVYNNSANIILNTKDMLNINFNDKPLPTNGMYIENGRGLKEMFTEEMGKVGVVKDGKIYFQNLELDYSDAEILDNSFKALQIRNLDFEEINKNIKKIRKELNQVPLKSLLLKVYLSKRTIDTDSNFETRLQEKYLDFFNRIRVSIQLKDSDLIKKDILSIIGLGPGLTPSGDDFFIGFITTALILKQYYNIFDVTTEMNEIKRYLSTISSHTLSGIQNGYLPGILIRIFELIFNYSAVEFKREFLKIEGYGHSSGEDLFTGVLLFLENYNLKT